MVIRIKHSRQLITVAVLAAVVGAIAGAAGGYFTSAGQDRETAESLIKEFYETENAVHVSPHSLRGKMDNGADDFILVDLRSAEEYEEAHIIGAVSIPAYSDRYTSAYDQKDRIIGEFRKLPKGRDIIVYCYSIPCMTGRKIGLMLAENGIYVKHLGIGWNEWRHDWTSWNHEHEWNITRVGDYIAKGKEPGKPKKTGGTSKACPISGDFGC